MPVTEKVRLAVEEAVKAFTEEDVIVDCFTLLDKYGKPTFDEKIDAVFQSLQGVTQADIYMCNLDELHQLISDRLIADGWG
jgi:hypothetical protein